MEEHLHTKKHLTSFQIIIIGFLAVILIGTLLLMLPFSTKSGNVTPFNEALFTATSAVCVTGLVIHSTALYWSYFGQAVILTLIQIGGLGVVTVAVSLALIFGKKISLMQRSTMQESIAAPKVTGIVKLTGFILKITFLVEILGGLIMMPVFCKEYGLKGIWMSFFHSISAFCNAGFDLLGSPEDPFSSLSIYRNNPIINMTIMFLIVFGGIGFLTWEDIKNHKLRFKQYRMQSKVILVTTATLIIIPTAYFYLVEFSDLPVQSRILTSLFQAITPRTAGFNTADLTSMTGAGQAIICALMLIGGSPGSTAGGMKTTTVAVLFANTFAVFKGREDAHLFSRRIDGSAVRNAATILMMYISLLLCGALIISIVEDLPMRVCIFETASAVGTVGLSLGITPKLGLISQIVLITLMFMGRVGGLTLVYAAFAVTKKNFSKLPQEKITVG